MATLLLIVIYVAFIGLGIPDSLLGTAWPAIFPEFGMPLSMLSAVSITISCFTTLSSMNSARVIKRFGTGLVTAVSTALTVLGLVGFALSGSVWWFFLSAIPLGLGAGCIDSALNNYVSLHYSATVMSFLHCFYGVGVTVSPYVLSLVISGESGWRGGYWTAVCIQAAIALVMILTIPWWRKAHGAESIEAEKRMKALPLRESLRIPGVATMCGLFLCFCAIEATAGGWGSTYLVTHQGTSPDEAAALVALFYVGMTLGRFFSGVLATRLTSWQIIRMGMIVLSLALALLLMPGPSWLAGAALLLIGLGNGPLYPNFNFLTPQHFGAEVSQSVMGLQMAASSVGVMIAPALCGLLGQTLGMGVFPWYLAAFYLLTLLGVRVFRRQLRERIALIEREQRAHMTLSRGKM